MTLINMQKKILLLVLSLLICVPVLVIATDGFPKESNLSINKDDLKWRIGGKIHFEEDNGSDYIGINEINNTVKDILKSYININIDSKMGSQQA